ncbi:MAG: hypothetical protein PVH19_15245 [Planctomycetia bacterium]
MSNQDTVKPLVSYRADELMAMVLPEDDPKRELDVLSESDLQSKETVSKKLVKVDRENHCIDLATPSKAYPYWIDLDRIDTNAKLVEWLRHLSEKDWFTASHVRQLIAITTRICPGVQPHYGA